MLIITRICLVLALVLGGASIYLGGQLQGDKRNLRDEITKAKTDVTKATAACKAAQADVQAKQKEAEQARAETKLLAGQVTEEKTKLTTALAQIEELNKRIAGMAQPAPVANTAELEAAKAKLAAAEQARDAALQQAKDAQDKIKALTDQVAGNDTVKKGLDDKIKELDAQVRYYTGKDGVALPDGLSGKVLYYDKTWNFTVLDIGKKKGVLPSGVMILHRGTEIVGKVRIATVDDDCCIADFLGDVKKKEPKPGDMAIP